MDPNDIDITTSPDAEASAEPGEQQGDAPTPEDEEQQQSQEQQGDEQEGEGNGEQPAKEQKPPVQQRINEITRARREAEARNRQLEQLVYNLTQRQQQGQQTPPSVQEPPAEQPPKESDFQDFATYQRAQLAYEARQTVRAEMQAERQRQQQSSQQADQARQTQEVQQRAAKMVETGRGKFSDFDDVALNPGVRMTPVMVEAIGLDETVGADVAYYLGKKPEEAARIAALSPARQVMEIGRLAERITSTAGKNKITKATPPIKPGGGRAKVNVDETKLSDEEWLRRRQQGKK